MSSNDAVIAFENIDKWYDDFHALKNINLSIEKGEKLVVCGPSGSGKSTLIRCINGLEQFDSGTLTVVGEPLTPQHLHSIRGQVAWFFNTLIFFLI